MSAELLDISRSQGRIRHIVTGLTQVIFLPSVQDCLNVGIDRRPHGWGLSKYRAGSSCLATTPSQPGEQPAEISFYPTLPEHDITGAIYWHGEGSNALKIGEILGFYLDEELSDGSYVNYLSARTANGGLTLNNRVDEGEDLRPPTLELVEDIERKIDTMLSFYGSLAPQA